MKNRLTKSQILTQKQKDPMEETKHEQRQT
nr:MAG TPA: hypothetical protein [Bacteriophage sp.]